MIRETAAHFPDHALGASRRTERQLFWGDTSMRFSAAALSAALVLASFAAAAADYPAPRQGEWIAKNFKFHSGETLAELRLHYTTVGEPNGQPVLVLHGSG